MRAKRGTTRPPIPDWAISFRDWDGLPDAPMEERRRQWSRESEAWLHHYGYNVFEECEAAMDYRQRTGRWAR